MCVRGVGQEAMRSGCEDAQQAFMQCSVGGGAVQDEEGLGTSVTGRGIYTMMGRRDT
jgi:hypothetical protein